MNTDDPSMNERLFTRIHRELIDAYDEELEMEVEDRPVTGTLSLETHEDSAGRKVRRHYFPELFRLKGNW